MTDNLTPQLKRILAMAAIEAERQGAIGVDVNHLLCAMFQEGSNIGADLFAKKI